MKLLITNSTIYVWVPVLFAGNAIHIPVVSHYYTDLQVAVMCQEMQQYIKKKKAREEDCKLVNMDV